jgi:hypothetical protein
MLRLKKAHMVAYDKQLKELYNDVRGGSNSLRRGDEEVVPHHIYIYISIITIMSKDDF